MPSGQYPVYAFNRGLISELALARGVDIERIKLSATVYRNWIPRALGSMMLRPGTQYIGATDSNAKAKFVRFISATDDTALCEFTDSSMRVWVDESVISRPSVSTQVNGGAFVLAVDVSLFWTDNDEAGAASAWVSGGYLGLTGTGTARAIRTNQVTVAVGDQGVEHALRVDVELGPVTIRVGSTSGGDDYVAATSLGAGEHSLAFTPTGDFYVQFESALNRTVLVDSCLVESAGDMTFTTQWTEADLPYIRGDADFSQSADVIYVACYGTGTSSSLRYEPKKIERRGTRSWSFVHYRPETGPFRSLNSTHVTFTPSALTGNITITASENWFKSGHAGALFKLRSTGQTVTADASAENTFTDPIRVTNVDDQRIFTITLSGFGTATVTLQRSFESESGPWTDVPSKTFSADTTESYNDGLDNQIAWYRIGIKTGDYTAGTITMTLDYTLGSTDGIVRIRGYSSGTSVNADVLTTLGGTDATSDWYEGMWSDYRGWPSAVCLTDGRLGWFGIGNYAISVSDGFENFDPDTEGDSGPIIRTLGQGASTRVRWALDLDRIILGMDRQELTIRTSSIDEPLTPSANRTKTVGSQGVANIQAVKKDDTALFVQRGGSRVFEIRPKDAFQYGEEDVSILVDGIGEAGFEQIEIQRQPDTRVHCRRSAGTVAILIYDRAENLVCWIDYETDGVVEDIVILPGADGDGEDKVYYVVNRTINGSTVRYLERWALESQCQGGTLNRQADSFILYSGAPTTTITGLSTLEGESVVVWGNGKDLGTYTVSGNSITVSESVTSAIVGLSYTAQWQSTKLAYTVGMTSPHRVSHIGVILRNTHYQGLKYGPTFAILDDLPLAVDGETTAEDTVHSLYDHKPFAFSGRWDTDARLCLQAAAPRPCTCLGVTLEVEGHRRG